MSYLYDYFSIIIFITINRIISLKQKKLVFWTPRVLLSFCLIFCQFEPGVAYNKKRVFEFTLKYFKWLLVYSVDFSKSNRPADFHAGLWITKPVSLDNGTRNMSASKWSFKASSTSRLPICLYHYLFKTYIFVSTSTLTFSNPVFFCFIVHIS